MARAVALALAGAAAAFVLAGLTRYAGSALVYVFFTLTMATFVALAFPRPRLYVYSFIALFLGMGLWAKTIVHTIWAPGFLEPTGDFRNTPAEWDRALIAMAAAALGLAAVRVTHLWYRHRRPLSHKAPSTAPRWFVRYRTAVWIVTLLALVAVNVANLQFAFFQIGVNPKVLLPLRLHILFAWLVNVGFAFWIAALLWWSTLAEPQALRRSLYIALVEAFASAVSAFSRSVYLVHATPYLLALWERRNDFKAALQRRHIILFVGGFALGLAAAIVTVFALRLQVYPLIDRATGARGDPGLAKNMSRELPQLVVQRWVGLEGVLTVGSVADRGAQPLIAAVTDSAKGGAESLYQRTAKLTPYRTDPTQFTFLTNAGPVAILLFGGSAVIVFAGMALITLVLVASEEAIDRWTGNPFLQAVAGAALANVVSQTTYFYLTLVFLVQLAVAVAAIAILERWRAIR